MKFIAPLLISIVATGCASTTGERVGEATCRVSVGMSETQFLDCACFRPYLNPTGGVQLNSTVEDSSGVTKRYGCMRQPGEYSQVYFKNGTVTRISTY